MKKIIYLDLDDTLADTTNSAILKFNVRSFTLTKKSAVLLNILSILKVWQGIKDTPQFWEEIPLKSDAYEIYEKSLTITSEIHILTALPILFFRKNTECFKLAAQAKKKWIIKNFPDIPEKNIHVVYAKEKHLMVQNNSDIFILVDDSKKNIKRWINAGGIGILVEKNSTNHLAELDKYCY